MKRNSTKWLLSTCVLTLATSFGWHSSHAAAPPQGAKATARQSLSTDRVIVKFKPTSTVNLSQQNLDQLAPASGVPLRHLRKLATGAEVLDLNGFRTDAELNVLLEELNARADVEYAEPDLIMKPLATPSDPRYSEQWHYFESTGGLNLPSAWDSTSGSGVVVGVIDTGYLPHADLIANLLPGYDMIDDTFVSQDGDGRDSDATDPGDWSAAGTCASNDPGSNSSWHGTHVAGTIAAQANNGAGGVGVAYNAKVVPIRVLGRCGGYTTDIADGIIWGAGGSVSGAPSNANPAQVLNLSLGGSGSCGNTTQSAIDTARSLGTTVVVAAGNSNVNASNATPANCNGVITVAATGRTGAKAYYSNYGSVVDLAAPGGDMSSGTADGVLSTLNSGSTTAGSDNYAFYQGTSMAAPHVAGAAALLYATDPTITPDEVESALIASVRSFPGSCSQCGAGIVDATAAIAYVSGDDGGGDSGGPLNNGVPVTGLAASTGQELAFSLTVPAGATDLDFVLSGGTGDADLYVRFGGEPTTSSYDCRPYLNGNNETCSFSAPQAGTYYVVVRAYSSFSGVSLVASYQESSGGGGGASGLYETNLSGNRNSWQDFSVEVPAGTSSLNVTMSGGTGDADLYVRFDALPSRNNYNCRPYLSGNNETCTISNPAAGTWYISIFGYSSYSGVTLEAE